MLKSFYTYMWLRADGTPYYVGKGNRDRALTNHGRRVTRKPKDPMRILIQDFPSEEDAFLAERFLIALYGRKDLGTGILHNRTDGGEGAAGRRDSETTRLRKSFSNRGKHQFWLGKKVPYTSRPHAKGGAHLKGKPWSAARRAAHEKRVSIRAL